MRAALDLVTAHPLTGVGPGRARFTWTTPAGREMVARYAHNEYLQVLVELGVIGLALVLLLIVVLVPTIRRGRTQAVQPALWSGAVAAATALAIHSGLDLLWQLAVIPMTAGMLIGLATPLTDVRQTSSVGVLERTGEEGAANPPGNEPSGSTLGA
jgi:O-antigen ligase